MLYFLVSWISLDKVRDRLIFRPGSGFQKGVQALCAERLGDLIEIGLGRVVNPMAPKIVSGCDLIFLELPLHTFGKKFADVFAVGERDVWSFIPGKALHYLGMDMTIQVRLRLQNQALVVSDVKGGRETGKASAEDEGVGMQREERLRRGYGIMQRSCG